MNRISLLGLILVKQEISLTWLALGGEAIFGWGCACYLCQNCFTSHISHP